MSLAFLQYASVLATNLGGVVGTVNQLLVAGSGTQFSNPGVGTTFPNPPTNLGSTVNPVVTNVLTANIQVQGGWQPSTPPQLSWDLDGGAVAITLAGITSIAGTFDCTKLTLVVQDPGFDSTGAATVVTRTIYGVLPVRRYSQDPLFVNNSQYYLATTDGVNLTVVVSLTDIIYAGSTIVSANVSPGFYTGSVGCQVNNITNYSTFAYPLPTFGWLTPRFLSTEGAGTIAVESVAFHRHAQKGQQVACIKYQATDGTNYGAISTVASPTLSTIVRQGHIPESYAANVDCSTLTQGATCTIQAVVYPWIGDRTNTLSLVQPTSSQLGYIAGYTYSIDQVGVAWPTNCPATPLTFLCDRTGTYGVCYAYVSTTGNDGTGLVSATAGTAAASPYATIQAALNATKVFNNGKTGIQHNDFGGAYVRLMNNTTSQVSYTWSTGAASVATQATWYTIEVDPSALGSVLLQNTGSPISVPVFCRIRTKPGTTQKLYYYTPAAAGFGIFGNNSAYGALCVDGLNIDNRNNKTTFGYFGIVYYYNLTLNYIGSGSGNAGLFAFGAPGIGGSTLSNSTAYPILAGCIGTNGGVANVTSAVMNVGNDIPNVSHSFAFDNVSQTLETSATSMASLGRFLQGRIAYNNRFKDFITSYGGAWSNGATVAPASLNNTIWTNQNNNHVYQALSSANPYTTSVTGAGPSGTTLGQVITDGNVTWQYIGEFPVTLGKIPCAVVQNTFEVNYVGAGNGMGQIFPDGDCTWVPEFIEHYNTFIGSKCNHYYNDSYSCQLTPVGIRKRPSCRYNIWDNRNIKSEGTLAPGFKGAGGNYLHDYGISMFGCVSLYGAVGRSNDAPSNIPVVSGPAWTTSTNYPQRYVVYTSGTFANSYICTQGGISASTGTGPSGAGTGIVDGTCIWSKYTQNGVGVGGSYAGASWPAQNLNDYSFQLYVYKKQHNGLSSGTLDMSAAMGVAQAFHAYTVGPWGSYTAVARNTAYSVGTYAVGGINGAAYSSSIPGPTWLCVGAGTTSAAGNGPDNTGHIVGDTVVDGTVTWKLVFPVAGSGIPSAGGDYRPDGNGTYASFLMNRVMSNQAALKYDLVGASRRNDGSGATGAYEYTNQNTSSLYQVVDTLYGNDITFYGK